MDLHLGYASLQEEGALLLLNSSKLHNDPYLSFPHHNFHVVSWAYSSTVPWSGKECFEFHSLFWTPVWCYVAQEHSSVPWRSTAVTVWGQAVGGLCASGDLVSGCWTRLCSWKELFHHLLFSSHHFTSRVNVYLPLLDWNALTRKMRQLYRKPVKAPKSLWIPVGTLWTAGAVLVNSRWWDVSRAYGLWVAELRTLLKNSFRTSS